MYLYDAIHTLNISVWQKIIRIGIGINHARWQKLVEPCHLSSGVFVPPVITLLESGKFIKIKTFVQIKNSIFFNGEKYLFLYFRKISWTEFNKKLNLINLLFTSIFDRYKI